MSKRTYLMNLSLPEESVVPEVFDTYVLLTSLGYKGPGRVTKSRLFEKILQIVVQQYPDGFPTELLDSEDILVRGFEERLAGQFRGRVKDVLTPLKK